MSNFLAEKLNSLQIFKDSQQRSLANYKPYVLFENLVFLSGHLPIKKNSLLQVGKVGENVDVTATKKSIQIATHNLLWTLSDAVDEIENIKKIKCVNIKGYLNCKNNFEDHSTLFDAASEIKQIAQYISPIEGGKGCVRDLIEKVLRAQDKWFNPEKIDEAKIW